VVGKLARPKAHRGEFARAPDRTVRLERAAAADVEVDVHRSRTMASPKNRYVVPKIRLSPDDRKIGRSQIAFEILEPLPLHRTAA